MNEHYFQTWPYVSTLGRVKYIGHTAVKTIQFMCGLFGHELSKTEWGYGGGDYCDRWCRWCNKLVRVPKSSIRFEFEDSGQLMKMLGRKVRKDGAAKG